LTVGVTLLGDAEICYPTYKRLIYKFDTRV